MQIPGTSAGRPLARSTPVAPRRGQRDRFTYVTEQVLAALTVGFLLFWFDPGLLLVTSVFAALISVAFLFRERQVPANAIVLVGRSPMSAMVAATLEQQVDKRDLAILRADHLAEAASLIRQHRCDELVLIGESHPSAGQLVDARGRVPALVPGAEKLERLLNRVPIELAMQDRWLGRLQGARPVDATYAFAKRVVDVAIAFGLAVVLLPVLPLVALAIKLDSRGPVFYSQQRVGLNGRVFRIYKFRTMHQDAEKNGAVWATERDARITRIGRFMRKTRLDELPQIWNLLRGDMALVGPRPERPEFTAQLAEQIPAYDLRHTVKPGLTGWAQVCYRYTNSVRDTRAKVEYDLYYVKHCSLLFDLRIMFRTVRVVLAMKGQ